MSAVNMARTGSEVRSEAETTANSWPDSNIGAMAWETSGRVVAITVATVARAAVVLAITMPDMGVLLWLSAFKTAFKRSVAVMRRMVQRQPSRCS